MAGFHGLKLDDLATKPYIKLCAAIVNSGAMQHDEEFLNSEWCQYLIDSVILHSEYRKNSISNIRPRKKSIRGTKLG